MNISIELIILSFSGLSLLALLLMVLRRPGLGELRGSLLVAYLVFTLAWLLLQTGKAISFQPELSAILANYGFIFSTLAFLLTGLPLLWPALVDKGRILLIALPAMAWPVLVILHDFRLFMPAAVIKPILLWAGWGLIQLSIGLLALHALRSSIKPAPRNQVQYWIAAWILLVCADLAYLFGQSSLAALASWSQLARLLAVVFAVSAYKHQRLPVLRETLRHVLLYFLFALPLAIVLAVGFLLLPMATRFSTLYGPILLAILLAALLLWMMITAWVRLPRLINRLVPTTSYNPNRILREYSKGISSINSMEILATVAVGLISEAIEIQRGFMFNVEYEAADGSYRLQGIGGMGAENPTDGQLAANSPIVAAFKQQQRGGIGHRILTYLEIELSPDLQAAPAAERVWFKQLDMEIMVPIHTKDDWIGLLVLGSKSSGSGYLEEDLTLIGTLADQTSIALQNARLVESLMRLNNEFRRQYAALETANRQLQQALNHLQKLDQTKSDFISVSSHELRTPLTVMRGYNEMLLEDPVIQANAYHNKLVKGIHSGMMRMHEVIDSMLDMASIDTRSLLLHKEPVSLNVLLRGLQENLTTPLTERKITLFTENLRDLPQIEADREMIYKVFYQLVTNAIKYTPDGGSITISGVPITPGELNMPEGGIEIIIADTGVGIKTEFLEVIFTKFYKTGELALHSTGKTKYKGSGPGLGLSIAKGIIEAHGGKVWAESSGMDEETFPGSQFHVVLPVKAA